MFCRSQPSLKFQAQRSVLSIFEPHEFQQRSFSLTFLLRVFIISTGLNNCFYILNTNMSNSEKLKPGPKSSEEERDAWSFVIYKITETSGLRPSQLESIFKVGDGSGRVWRTWMNAKKLGRNADGIIKIAIERGWLPTDITYIKNYSAVKAYSIQKFNHEALNLLPTPQPPGFNQEDKADFHCGILAHQLLEDAKDINQKRRHELECLKKPHKSPITSANAIVSRWAKSEEINKQEKKRLKDSLSKEFRDENQKAGAIVKSWEEGAIKLARIRDDLLTSSSPDNETKVDKLVRKANVDEMLRIQLRIAYKNAGYYEFITSLTN